MLKLWSLSLLLVPWAWLVPDHYFPWVSAWSDGWALLSAGLAAALLPQLGSMSRPWACFIALATGTVTMQWVLGSVSFGGDALMCVLYLAALGLAIMLGPRLVPQGPATGPSDVLGYWSASVLFAAIASVGIALNQWTDALNLGVWVSDFASGSRPYGNVAQPNHLNTIAFLGLCSLALLGEMGWVQGWRLCLGAMWLVAGMVMTGSRTGWLQAALALVLLGLSKRATPKTGLKRGSAVALLYALAVASWPQINDSLRLSSGRLAEDIAAGGTRTLHWASMAAAVAFKPWWGYGWLQGSSAQWQVASERPPVGEYIEFSHNQFLDLLVWSGVPIGLMLGALLAYWYWTRLSRCHDGVTLWMLVAIGGLAVHALLEYPLSYAYFLVPFGIWAGAVDQIQGVGARWQLRARQGQMAGALFATLVVWLAVDYFKAEQGFRLMRLESARIGARGLSTPPPDLQLLTQLEAFQQFAHTEARAAMTPAELAHMKTVALRFGYPPVLFRLALAQALNGDQAGAAETLLKLCRIHPRTHCLDARVTWTELSQRSPPIHQVPWPAMH